MHLQPAVPREYRVASMEGIEEVSRIFQGHVFCECKMVLIPHFPVVSWVLPSTLALLNGLFLPTGVQLQPPQKEKIEKLIHSHGGACRPPLPTPDIDVIVGDPKSGVLFLVSKSPWPICTCRQKTVP